MKKFFCLALLAMSFSFASFAQSAITGATYLCLGNVAHVTDSLSPGGTWSSSNTAVATVTLTTGDVYGVSAGTTTLTYTLGGSFVTAVFTVYPAGPASITGTTSFCVGASSQLSDITPGGTWTSSNMSVATVSAGGLVYGVTAGHSSISYSTSSGPCNASVSVSVNNTNAGSISGPSSVCVGSSIAVTDSSTGGLLSGTSGTWSSSNTAIATVASTSGTAGTVTGIAAGTATITFTTSGTCGSGYTPRTITVSNTTTTPVISGSTTVNTGATTTLYGSPAGGTWSGSGSVATITTTGLVTGVSSGTAVLTYTYTGCGGAASATYTVTVSAINGISGYVNFTGSAYYGSVKVWLINYNPTTMYLGAIDSLSLVTGGSSSVHYQFLGLATDSYRVKAAIVDTFSTTATTGYIPTYHTSSFYWYNANVIYHNSGTADINDDINMVSGTPTSGPGFIAGYVYAGANKSTGTATTIPVIGLHMHVLNATSNQLIESVITDINGHYSFGNLPVGTYYIFPDSLNYKTTAYTGITLTSGASSMSAANFTQHTVSQTITPNTTGISNINSTTSTVFAFPNPTSGKLNLQWQGKT